MFYIGQPWRQRCKAGWFPGIEENKYAECPGRIRVYLQPGRRALYEIGQNKLASALSDAFTKYKKEYDRKQGGVSAGANTRVASLETRSVPEVSSEPETQDNLSDAPVGSEEYILNKKKNTSTSSQRKQSQPAASTKGKSDTTGKIIYKVQILTSDKKLSPGAKVFKGYKNVNFFVEKGIYKYTYGETTDFDSIRKLRRQVAKDFKDAFIVAFKDGKKVKY